MRLTLSLLGVVVGALLLLAMMSRWDHPPVAAVQLGPNGLGMMQITNPRTAAKLAALNQSPAADPPAKPSGKKVKDDPMYKNVQVLGELDTEEFNRLMGAITTWVAPTEGDNAGCNYCHNPENMAEDKPYTKVVARRMIQMTQAINSTWKTHVAVNGGGVTCYTCHRGNPIPNQVWFTNPGPERAAGFAANPGLRDLGSKIVGSTALPFDPMTKLFAKDAVIPVVGKQALTPRTGASIQDTETTYALMIYLSKSLGVNCTYCHNSRQFANWPESRPQRVTAWHGIKMVTDLYDKYLSPLKSTFPATRLGPTGDVAHVGCATCHEGLPKPLLGVSLVKDYPELAPTTN